MSGVISIGSAVAATAFAASSVASVGLTIGSAFAITAAVGATLGAAGAVFKVKELQYAGAALGAVGLIGGVASAAGLFGEAGSLFAGASDVAGAGGSFGPSGAGELGLAGSGAAAATDTGGWAGVTAGAVGAPTDGYGSVGALMEGQRIVAGEIPGFDAIDMVNGIPQVSTGTPEVATALAPDVTPTVASDTVGGTFGEGHPGLVDSVPAYESPTKGFDAWANGGEVPAPRLSGDVPDPAKSILNHGWGNEGGAPRDAFGNVISQGTGPGESVPGDLGAGVRNPASPGTGFNEPVTGTAAPTPSGVAGTPATTPTAAPNAVTGSAETGLIGNAPTGPYSATLAPDAAIPKMSLINGVSKVPATPLEGPSSWSGVFDWVQRNQMLGYGAVQAIGSFVSGALKPGTPQSVIDELNSRMAANTATANLYNKQAEMLQQRMNNMNAPMPVAVRGPRSILNGGFGAVTGQVG